MKIKSDFVTNSSSTSFIIILSNGFELDHFMDLVGVNKKSPLFPIFEELYNLFCYNMEQLDGIGLEIEKKKSHENVADRMTQAIQNGKKIYSGSLTSEETHLEYYFATDSFEIENENIYINYLDNQW